MDQVLERIGAIADASSSASRFLRAGEHRSAGVHFLTVGWIVVHDFIRVLGT